MYAFREAVLNRCIENALQEKDPEKSINLILRYLGQLFKADRAYIFELHGLHWDNTYEWCNLDVPPQIANLWHIPNENLDVRIKQFVKGDHIIIEDLEYVKDTHKDMYDTLNIQGIKSLVVAPIFESSEVRAFFGLDNPCNDLNYTSNFLGITDLLSLTY